VSFARKVVKSASLPLGLWQRRSSGDVVILLYHTLGAGLGEIDTPVDGFDRHLAALARREFLLTLDQVVNDGAAGGIAVTFDDAYRDFYDRVLPLLVRYQVPATLYWATGLVAGRGREERSHEPLTWSQLREAQSTGLVTIGSHTHNHVDLSRASETQAEDEMRRSKDLIEDQIGSACRHFAYPWAVGSPAADRVARRLFDTAALDAWRTNRAGRIDPHRLGRTPILRSDGQLFFRAKVNGLLDGERVAYRLLRRGPWGVR